MILERIEKGLYVFRRRGAIATQSPASLHRQAASVAQWLATLDDRHQNARDCGVTWGRLLEIEPVGTSDHFQLCANVLERAQIHASVFGPCDAELVPALVGLEGKRVDAMVRGERVRFQVGKSGGWLPCHLMLHNKRSRGGDPVLPHEIENVQVVNNPHA